MRAVHVTPSFLPHLGGVETHVSRVCQELAQLGHENVVVTGSHDQRLPQLEQLTGVMVHRLPHDVGQGKWALWRAIMRLRPLFAQADIVQVHDVWWWLLPLYPLIARKLFTTFHGWEGRYPVRVSAQLHRWLAAITSVKIMHVGDWIQEFYWDQPDCVTYGGVDAVRIARAPQTKAKKIVPLAFVGRLTPENNIAEYLKLIAQLRAGGLQCSMTWIGDGPLREQCQRTGRVTGMTKNVPHLLRGLPIVFANSYLSILQAQAAGAVVCAFYTNRLKQRYLETFPGASALCMSQNPAELAERVRALLANPSELERQRQVAAQFAREQTWRRVAEGYLQLWK